ncbi:hypothetical protein ACJMK2_010471 [Sinanodonta woodiana]|uniref:Amino acid transporter transmembrane domain-containing protein n=1 Tax=Sinanodonta woodiana TaxID=1069815 RepID=A0ABD3VIE8_SINWO
MSVQNQEYEYSQSEERIGLITEKPLDKLEHKKGTTWYASVFLVVNAALGAGLLNFPQAYERAGGLLVAILIQAVFVVFVLCALLILAYCSDLKKTCTYQDTVLTVCGQNAQRASAICLTAYCFGTCITFLIIIGDQWEEFFLSVAYNTFCHDNPWYMNRITTIMVTSTLLILPLCFPRRIDFLKYPSMVGVVAIFYVVAVVTAEYFQPHDSQDIIIKTRPDKWMDVFIVVPTICFGYQCHVSVIPIYSCMEGRNIRDFSKTAGIAMLICVITYTGTAAFGYLTFGDKVTSDILLSYDHSPVILIAVILIAVKTYTTYPILLFCGRASFECLWIDLRRLSPDVIKSHEKLRHIVITIVWFIATIILASFIPNIEVVIQLLGTLAATFIFIFPGMCLLVTNLKEVREKGTWSRKNRFLFAVSAAFLILGAFIFGLTLTQSIMNDIDKGVSADKSKYTC